MRVMIATDAWTPQLNGVVVTLGHTVRGLETAGHQVEVIGPDRFRSVPCPSYPEIRLALLPLPKLGRLLERFEPDAIHIATEGPIGLAMRRLCLRRGLRSTTAYHTRFPEYVYARWRVPVRLSYAWLRWFHAPSQAIMVATAAIENDLCRRGFSRIVRWSRGVDTALFKPGVSAPVSWPRPVFMYVGRVAVEKNIDAFLSLDLPGTKVIVGDGPQRAPLERRHPAAVFVGVKRGEELAQLFRSADAFVFPSRTDTFGLVLLEAMASGTPVAAFPVPGPVDVVTQGASGVLDEDLRAAALAATRLDRATVRRYALGYSWERSTAQFISYLHPNPRPVPTA